MPNGPKQFFIYNFIYLGHFQGIGREGKNCPFFLHDNKSSRFLRTFLMSQDYRAGMIGAFSAFSGYVVIFQKCIQAGAGQTGYLTGLFDVAAGARHQFM